MATKNNGKKTVKEIEKDIKVVRELQSNVVRTVRQPKLVSSDGQPRNGDSKGIVQLLPYIFEPTDERLCELTELAYDVIPALVWMVTFEKLTSQLANDINKCRALWYGIDKPEILPPMATEDWRKALYQHNRSRDGSGKMMASTLAMEQIRIEQLNAEMGEVHKW